MTKERLQTLKSVTTWGGVMVTLSGIVFNLIRGGSWQGNSIALGGLLITCSGHWITKALSDHQKAEKAEDVKRIAELEDRIESAEGVTGDSTLKRLIRKEASRYADEHQDDGR